MHVVSGDENVGWLIDYWRNKFPIWDDIGTI